MTKCESMRNQETKQGINSTTTPASPLLCRGETQGSRLQVAPGGNLAEDHLDHSIADNNIQANDGIGSLVMYNDLTL